MTLSRYAAPVAAAVATSVLGLAAPASATHDFRVTSDQEQGGVSQPLAGRTIVIDPGHQLGNHNFPGKIDRLVPAGGFKKPCNTTGTATNGGYPEATFTWRVARLLRERLERLGAQVRLTRHSNRQDKWGPCVDVRGRDGNRLPADLKLSIHGDGSYAAGARGFHVIAPTDRRPWTHDIYRPSRRLAVDTRAALRGVGLRAANYIAGGDGLDFRSDLGTLNLADVPTVMVELGNMRNARDAHRMTSKAGRATYARGLALAVRRFLD
jgi:N-acetylmuramoyl-L-alanine amidase